MARINAVERESGCVRVSEKAQKKCMLRVCGVGCLWCISCEKGVVLCDEKL